MTTSPAIGGVVDNLVTQFASALDCFRELVQNSIDAGTSRVDVWAEFEAGDGHVGTIAFHVDDFGEGMDERIIDDQLTKLFASTKENDLTKIGKFGIGFVSVFALKPKAVLLNTGRGGEYWEVLFHEDRSFSKTRLDYPVEGTQVTIFLEGDYHRYRDLVEGVRATLEKWCRHSETEVTFEDRSPVGKSMPQLELINEEFEVDGVSMVQDAQRGSEFVLAYSTEPVYGFYNRGLTLAYTNVSDEVFTPLMARRFAYISVKIKSRYLEHTLSRDAVMRDHNYHQAMQMLRTAADRQLLPNLLSDLEAVAATSNFDIEAMQTYATLFEFLMNEPTDAVRGSIMKRRIFRSLHGEVFSPNEVWESMKEHGRILVDKEPSKLTEVLHDEGIPVFVGDAGSGRRIVRSHPLTFVHSALAEYVTMREGETLIGSVKRWFGLKVLPNARALIARPSNVYFNVAIDESVDDRYRPLLEGASRVLDESGLRYRTVSTCTAGLTYAEPPLFVSAKKLAPVMSRPAPTDPLPSRMEAAVNRDHPFFQRLVGLHRVKPALAEYCLARALLLHRDTELDHDPELMVAANELHGLLD